VPFQKTLEKLYDIPIVGDIRGAGFFWGIEMVKNRETRESFNSDESEQLLRGFLSKALFDNGLCVATQQILCSPCHDVVAGTAGLTTGETQSSSWRPPSFAPRSTSTRLRCTAPARHLLQSLRRRRSQHQQRVTPRVFPRNTRRRQSSAVCCSRRRVCSRVSPATSSSPPRPSRPRASCKAVCPHCFKRITCWARVSAPVNFVFYIFFNAVE
jgi:hypothetical protein